MATSSRQSNLFGINDWKSIYKNYSRADFQSYDYESLRKVFVDYLRTNYPETFNDYVESSEYVALLDVIAFMGQALAFRNDLNTRENFIDTAERRDSVIKLANLVGYSPKRNIAGQGYLKVSSISTSEQIKDINGLVLSNLTILWNDPANPNWQEQMNTIFNAALVDSQRIGRPGNSSEISSIKTDEYSIRLNNGTLPVLPFSAIVDGTSMNFECVSVSATDGNTINEISPGNATEFNILYRNDRLGYGSSGTGFFLYFKQGSLQNYNFSLAEQFTNQVVDINIQGINNDDTWLYHVDLSTVTTTEWQQVDNIYSVSKAQTSNRNMKVFSVSSRSNDQVSYNFGDGVFGEMPIGNFVAYYRTSNGLTYTIDPSEMQGITVAIPYISRTNRQETLTVTMELPLPVSTAQARETLANIKERAPQRYYTQNRMVNGEDYNNFPFVSENSIIKSKAINRSSVGTSRNYDFLDPSAKYSSTNDFADDGGIFMDYNDGFATMSSQTTNDMIKFLTENLVNILDNHKITQYYNQMYTRYTLDSASGDNTVEWNQSSFNAQQSTGYFSYNSNPVNVGIYAGGNKKYITEGALLKFVAPAGKYFSENYRLVDGIPGASDITTLWTSVISVEGDGSNNGLGNLSNGFGPVTLSNSVPDGAVLTQVLPSFSNTLGNDLVQELITKLTLSQDFCLRFNNTLLSTQERWFTDVYDHSEYMIRFRNVSYGSYIVSYRSLTYYFGSVSDVRFVFDRDKIVYDPLSGKLARDHIKILKTNSQPTSNSPLNKDITLNVVGQPLEADGYVDNYAVEIAGFALDTNGTDKNPDFFTDVAGFNIRQLNTRYFTFFKQVIDANMMMRYEMIPTTDVVYDYGTMSDIAVIKYEYPVGQIYFAVLESKFYKSVNDTTSANIVNLVEVSDYGYKYGRQGLYFQYKHISNDTTRIDPATSNIIDIYVLTQDYYTQYRNWIKDNTGKISEPSRPTIRELSNAYNDLSNYKMISDSIIFNSARFKPLFGSKADSKLQATLKVIKASNTNASDSEIRNLIIAEINNYFSIENWNFGDKFYFSELSAYLHSQIGDYISSIVLVPKDPNLKFGDLYEIYSAPYEIFANAAQTDDIVIISALTANELQIAS